MAKTVTRKKTASKKEKSASARNLQPASRPGHGLAPLDEMERWFSEVFRRGLMQPPRLEWPEWAQLGPLFERGRMPRVDVIERDREVLVRAEVPGVNKEDLEISVAERSVTIRGSTRHEQREESGDYHRREIAQGSFTRTVSLPAEVDPEKASARFENGILELTLPRAERARRKTIKVA